MFRNILKSKINLLFCNRYDNDHIYQEIPFRIEHPTNEETDNNQIGDNNPEVYSTIEEISPNTAYEEINDETDNQGM